MPVTVCFVRSKESTRFYCPYDFEQTDNSSMMTRATLYAVRLMPQIFNFCFHIIYIQSQDFDICFFSFHDCWDYWQNGLAKSERAIVAMTTAVIAMAVTNTSIDSRSIVSIIILLIFFVAKISGIKRLYNQNLTETEKSASQSPESAFETISEVSVHLLPNSRLRRRYDRKMQRMHARIIRSEWSEVHFPV